jgi:hypothetical protein
LLTIYWPVIRRFNKQAAALNVSATDLYNALLVDAEVQSPNWNLQGRQADLWKQLGVYFFSFFTTLLLLNFSLILRYRIYPAGHV